VEHIYFEDGGIYIRQIPLAHVIIYTYHKSAQREYILPLKNLSTLASNSYMIACIAKRNPGSI